MRSWTTSTKAATSWSVTRSRSATAATIEASTTGARSRTRRASSAGITPSAGPGGDRLDLDLEPHAEAGLVGEEGGHLRPGVAGDHEAVH